MRSRPAPASESEVSVATDARRSRARAPVTEISQADTQRTRVRPSARRPTRETVSRTSGRQRRRNSPSRGRVGAGRRGTGLASLAGSSRFRSPCRSSLRAPRRDPTAGSRKCHAVRETGPDGARACRPGRAVTRRWEKRHVVARPSPVPHAALRLGDPRRPALQGWRSLHRRTRPVWSMVLVRWSFAGAELLALWRAGLDAPGGLLWFACCLAACPLGRATGPRRRCRRHPPVDRSCGPEAARRWSATFASSQPTTCSRRPSPTSGRGGRGWQLGEAALSGATVGYVVGWSLTLLRSLRRGGGDDRTSARP